MEAITEYSKVWEQTHENWNKNLSLWVEISEDVHYRLLEVLPPIYTPFGYLVSEAVCHSEFGAVYLAVADFDGKYYASMLPKTHALQLQRDNLKHFIELQHAPAPNSPC